MALTPDSLFLSARPRRQSAPHLKISRQFPHGLRCLGQIHMENMAILAMSACLFFSVAIILMQDKAGFQTSYG